MKSSLKPITPSEIKLKFVFQITYLVYTPAPRSSLNIQLTSYPLFYRKYLTRQSRKGYIHRNSKCPKLQQYIKLTTRLAQQIIDQYYQISTEFSKNDVQQNQMLHRKTTTCYIHPNMAFGSHIQPNTQFWILLRQYRPIWINVFFLVVFLST